MSFLNHIKQVAPRLSLIKSRQPAMLLGNKVIVAGIGGNFIPGAQSSSDSTSAAAADISAGYITVSDSVVTLHDLTKGTTSIADKIYIPDTGVEEPDYAAGGTPQPVPVGAGVVDVYKVTSTSPLTGVKATQYLSDTWLFLSLSVSLIADPNNTPMNNSIYIASGTQLIGARIKSLSVIPTEGLVFNAPLDASASVTKTGQTISTSGTVTYQILQNIPCACFYGNGGLQCSSSGVPTESADRTVSLWLKCRLVTKSYMFAYGQLSTRNFFSLMIQDDKLGFVSWGSDYQVNNSYTLTNWIHYLVAYQSGTIKLYVNGTLDRSITTSLTTQSGNIYIGERNSSGLLPFYGYISNIRVYNRALSDALITALASLFQR